MRYLLFSVLVLLFPTFPIKIVLQQKETMKRRRPACRMRGAHQLILRSRSSRISTLLHHVTIRKDVIFALAIAFDSAHVVALSRHASERRYSVVRENSLKCAQKDIKKFFKKFLMFGKPRVIRKSILICTRIIV